MSVLNNSNAIESGGYNIDRSLRFRSSASANLSRTPASASSANIWTWSTWIKRGSLGTGQSVFNARDYTNSGNSYPFADISFTSADQLGYNEAYNGSYVGQKVTTQVFRDPSAWYHIVIALDTTLATAADRVKLYVNGNRITSFSTSIDPSGYTSVFSSNKLHRIGAGSTAPSGNANAPFDGYLADTYFVSGQALTPSSFGQTDAVTGVWTPKKYTGTYGTNGFYLDFKTNTSPTTLAQDKSGNGNNWTANNISTTSGASYDSMTDVPTLTSATAANYCVVNAVDKLNTIINGNLTATTTSGYSSGRGTFGISSGKWYWEQTVSVTTLNAGLCQVGGGVVTAAYALSSGNGNAGMWGFQNSNGAGSASWKFDNGAGTNSYTVFNTGDIAGFALDMDTGSLTVYRNNTSLFTANTSLSGNTVFPYISTYASGQTATSSMNFGQRPFSYTPPTGFKALNTFNLPDPTIKKPNQYMDATTYTGNGTGQSIVNSGSMQPDLVWIKARSAAYNHGLIDSVRGITKFIYSNLTNQEATCSAGKGITALNSNGFTLGTESDTSAPTNENGTTFVGWQWKKGATPGFDIVTWTQANPSTLNHSLGVKPAMIIIKGRGTTDNWVVWHQNLTNQTTYALQLNTTTAQFSSTALFNSTAPTSTQFTVGTGSVTNGTLAVAYLFAEIAGFSKFGNYTGNGSSDGPFVYTNFQPKYVLIKRTNSTGNWYVWDTTRNTYNVVSNELYPNLSNAEASNSDLDVNSNGFKIRNTTADFNASGGTYIYAAFSTFPFKYSTAR